eukprot:8890046-Pyramimonas_sp.AAC.1
MPPPRHQRRAMAHSGDEDDMVELTRVRLRHDDCVLIPAVTYPHRGSTDRADQSTTNIDHRRSNTDYWYPAPLAAPNLAQTML